MNLIFAKKKPSQNVFGKGSKSLVDIYTVPFINHIAELTK